MARLAALTEMLVDIRRMQAEQLGCASGVERAGCDLLLEKQVCQLHGLARGVVGDIQSLRLAVASPSATETERRILRSAEWLCSRRLIEALGELEDAQRRHTAARRDAAERCGGALEQACAAAKQELLAAEEREARLSTHERQVAQLESSIVELQALFESMGLLVEAHGAVLDNVELSISEAARRVEAGTKHLQAAARSKSAERRKIAKAILIALAVLAVVAAVAL